MEINKPNLSKPEQATTEASARSLGNQQQASSRSFGQQNNNGAKSFEPSDKNSRAEQARINGSKSKGPKTPEGKARSSRNGETHGAYSGEAICINLLSTDSQNAYLHLRAAWAARLRPQCPVEAALVDRVADSQWRLSRAIQHETAMLQHQIDIDAADFDLSCQSLSLDEREFRRSALAADNLRQSGRGLDYHLRIQSTLERQTQRLIKQLKELRADFPLASPQPLPQLDLFGPPTDEANPNGPEVVENTAPEPGQESPATAETAALDPEAKPTEVPDEANPTATQLPTNNKLPSQSDFTHFALPNESKLDEANPTNSSDDHLDDLPKAA